MKICDKAKEAIKGINNLPEYAYANRYIVFTTDRDGCWWFWGAYNDGVHAGMVGYHINGCILDMETGEVHRKEDLL